VAAIGLDAYRFSVSWPRILPIGRGPVNHRGLDFYQRLVDSLLEAGITPFLTLYHWDLPQVLQDEGGWTARSTAESFLEFTQVMTETLGDRVKYWMTLNEPWVSAVIGYDWGIHAPGHRDKQEMLAASHHLLLAHGWAVPIIRENVPGASIGFVKATGPQVPASNSEADKAAARIADGLFNRWYLDPIAGRGYPEDIVKLYGGSLDFVRPGDMLTMAAPIDFLGVNYYQRGIIRSDKVNEIDNEPRLITPNPELTAMGWEVYPEGLHDILVRLHRDYPFPEYYVTENGAAYDDKVAPNGAVDDPKRLEYLKNHFLSAAQAIESGVPLRGYFVWSLLDNFEWAEGLSKRFGIIYVDFETQRRTLKSSAHWLRRVIEANEVVD